MPDTDARPGGNEPAPGELRHKAQESVREWVASAGERERAGQWRVTPAAAIVAVAVAVCVPVAGPLLAAGGGAAAVTAALAQVGGLGSGLLAEAVIRAWDRVRSRDERAGDDTELGNELSAELQTALTAGTETATALRAEIAGLLRNVEAVQVALTAAVEESAIGVQAVLVRGLQELGAELGWAVEDIIAQLSLLMEDVAALRAAERKADRDRDRIFVQLYVQRKEFRAALGQPIASRGRVADGGPSEDERRAAALDAAGIAISQDCPYPGMAAFQPGDAGRFFGRDELTASLVARAGELLARPGPLMVLGPSGSGKSSLLRAGLIPAIAAGALPVRGSWAWPWELMTPGREPLTELAVLITAHTGAPPWALAADLRSDPARVTAAIRQALLAISRRRAAASLTGASAATEELRLVLVVDQFEEVFTQCGAAERATFIRVLCAAAGAGAGADAPGQTWNRAADDRVDSRDAPALVVLGVRADFYARCALYPELLPYLQDQQILVGPIGDAGLRAAIERPADKAGLVVDSALVEVLLADLGMRDRTGADSTGYGAGRLALLGYALQQTWRNREGRRLTLAGYHAAGGIDGAVAQAAERVYAGLSPEGRDILQRVLLRMVALGEGTADTRRRVSLTELGGSGDVERHRTTRRVLEDLIAARLVTADADTAEITHETLLTAWDRLRQWLAADRAGLRVHRELTDAAREWQREGRDRGRLFRGTRLAVTQDWAARHGQDLNDNERAFLDEARRAKQRASLLRRAAAGGLAVLTAVAVAIAVIAVRAGNEAAKARDQAVASQHEAIADQIITEADQLAAADPSLAAQLDLVAAREYPAVDDETRMLNAAAAPLASDLSVPADPDAAKGAEFTSLAFSPDGKTMAAATTAGKVWLWDTDNPRRPAWQVPGTSSYVSSVAFSHDGDTLAGADPVDRKVWLWNTSDPRHPVAFRQPITDSAPVSAVAFSPTQDILAIADSSSTTWLYDTTNPASPVPDRRLVVNPATTMSAVAFSPDGNTLATGADDGEIDLWNVAAPASPAWLAKLPTSSTTGVESAAFSPNGSTLATGSADGKVYLWDTTTLTHPTRRAGPLSGPSADVSSMAFSGDGNTLAASSADGKVWLWDSVSASQLGQPLVVAANGLDSVAFRPREGTLATGGYVSQGISLWDLPPDILAGANGGVASIAYSPDGRTVAAETTGSEIVLWDASGPARPLSRESCTSFLLWSVAFSPDGRTLATTCSAAQQYDDQGLLWNTTNPALPLPWRSQPLVGSELGIIAVRFRRPGNTLAALVGDGNSGDTIWLWNTADPAHPVLLGESPKISKGDFDSMAFSPDGRTLAVGGYTAKGVGEVWLWNTADLARPALIRSPLTGPAAPVRSVAFSADGRTLAGGSADGKVWLWDTANPARPAPLHPLEAGGAAGVTSVAFSPHGSTLAVGADDGTVSLWDFTRPARPVQLGQSLTGPVQAIMSIAFSPDGDALAVAGDDGTVRIRDLDVDDAIHQICTVGGGALTAALWKQYVPQLTYDPPCSDPGHYGVLTR